MSKTETSPIGHLVGGKMQGLIVENISNLYKVKADDKIYETTARGKFKKDEISPVVGDFVDISVMDEEKNIAVIEKIEERKVYIKRPKLANITQIIFVVSSKDPKPDLLMLDKQLAFAEYVGVNAIIVLNKTDLDQKEEFRKIKQIYSKIGYTVILTDAKQKQGIDELKELLKNNVNAFSGNSGVGKSTLINAIFNKDGIIGTCEGDVPALISMYLVKKMNDEPTFQANPSQIDVEKNEIILAHCTLPLSMCTSYKLTTHFESGIGVAIKGELDEKNISIVRIASTLDKYVMLHGKIVENLNFGNLCRTQVRIKMNDDSSVSYFLKKPLGNHHIIFYGNDTKNLEAYLEAHGLVRVDSSR